MKTQLSIQGLPLMNLMIIRKYPHRNLVILAKFYGVSTDYLLGMTENRQLANIALSNLHLSDISSKTPMKRHNPDEYNLQLNTLKAQHIELNEYFPHVIDDDIHAIIKDIEIPAKAILFPLLSKP